MFDIVGAFSAEMDGAAAEFFQKFLVERHDVFFVHVAGDIHDGIVAEHDVAMMAEAPMACKAVGRIWIFAEPTFQELRICLCDKSSKGRQQLRIVIERQKNIASPDDFRGVQRPLQIRMVDADVFFQFWIGGEAFFEETAAFENFR